MCNSKMKPSHAAGVAMDSRQFLQPACNRIVVAMESARTFKKSLQRSLSSPITITIINNAPETSPRPIKKLSPPISPKPIKRRNVDPNSLNSSTESKVVVTPKLTRSATTVVLVRKKSSETTAVIGNFKNNMILNSSYELDQLAPGSIAAAQREQASLAQAQRKMKIAHYGRVSGKQTEKLTAQARNQEEKRCSFITTNSDPVYVAYHDEEWGVPVHDNNMLFELLVLSGLQVGLDWTTILKKRDEFRSAFDGFDAELVGRFTETQIGAISTDYGIDLGKIRGVVDNSHRILEVVKDFGSFDKYLWAFVNHKAISTKYKSGRNIPVKTSKSESISKDMVRRGFRLVGPTVIHSFMQAAGLTNDHILSCPRHLHCSTLN